MPIPQLSDEQIRTWTRTQKDEWWLREVYRGDVPQLTWRSGLAGFFLGGILSATALYIGAKTGITIGVGLTSVILAFALFKVLSRARLAGDISILENNCTQSIASAAGYMIMPLIGIMPAYMLVTGQIIPWWQMMAWNTVMSALGVLFAFPLKRRFINEDQLPFPEGRASGVVLATLYEGSGERGLVQARVLTITASAAAALQFLMSEGWQRLLQFKLLRMDQWLGWTHAWHLRERIDDYYYVWATKAQAWIPKIAGIDIRTLGLRIGIDAAMVGVGGLMGIRMASSVLIGTLVNFAVLAPWMIHRGDIAPRVSSTGQIIPINRAEIVTQWSIWWGVTMMVVGSLVTLCAKPEIFTAAWHMVFRRKKPTAHGQSNDVLRHIELPLSVSYVGIPILGAIGVWLTHWFFNVPWLLAVAAVPMTFVLTIICTTSMGLTSWTSTSTMAKITQITLGAIDRSNPATNLMTGGMTSEVALNGANLLSDIKPGYMLGAKPRQQAIGHCIGIIAGALASTPLFFLLFLPKGTDGTRSPTTLLTDAFPFPKALEWKGVSDLVASGLKNLPTSAIVAMGVAAVLAIAMEVTRLRTRNRFPISSVGIGLGVVLPPDACLMMFVGAFTFWFMGRRHATPGTKGHTLWVDCCEPICAGLISGAALIGIGNAMVSALMR
jgi:OPT family oligopeptide transporter